MKLYRLKTFEIYCKRGPHFVQYYCWQKVKHFPATAQFKDNALDNINNTSGKFRNIITKKQINRTFKWKKDWKLIDEIYRPEISFGFDYHQLGGSSWRPTSWTWRRGSGRRSPLHSSRRWHCPGCQDCTPRRYGRQPEHITNWLTNNISNSISLKLHEE